MNNINESTTINTINEFTSEMSRTCTMFRPQNNRDFWRMVSRIADTVADLYASLSMEYREHNEPWLFKGRQGNIIFNRQVWMNRVARDSEDPDFARKEIAHL